MLLYLKNEVTHHSKVTCEKAVTLLPDIREDILLSWEEQITLIEAVRVLDYQRIGHIT